MLVQMADLCARSEQCRFDIEKKLRMRRMEPGDVEWIVNELEERGFIDESRYARSFARDKVRFSGWGRNKIRMALAARFINSVDVNNGLNAIEENDYDEALMRCVRGAMKRLDPGDRNDMMKLYRHVQSRGYESALIGDAIRRVRETEEK